MSENLCPMSGYNAGNLTSYQFDAHWYQSKKKKCMNFALMTSFLILMLIVTCIFNNLITIKSGCVLLVLGSAISLVFSINVYIRLIQTEFSHKNGYKIPVCGIFKTLYDVLMRPKVLLRDIDVERMRKNGDVYLMFAGFRPAIVITSSELTEEISNFYELYSKSDPRELNMPFFYDWVGNNNVVLANGKKWRDIRELIHSSVNEIHVFASIFHEKASKLCDAISTEYKKNRTADGANIILTRWLKAVSLDSAGVALFGYDFNNLNEVSNPGIDAMDYVINEIFDPIRIACPIKNRLPLASNKRLRDSMKHLDALVLNMISHIRENSAQSEGNVLEILINGRHKQVLSIDELRNNILALVLASHETTQVSLVGVLYYLAKYPKYQDQLRQESLELFPNLEEAFANINDKKDLYYRKLQTFHSMGNFILECLRLYSPLANQNPRTTTAETVLGEYRIPKGTLVIMNIHAIHMSDKEWKNPEHFDPGRFNKSSCQNKYAYLPFGSGVRLCSGRSFSLTIMPPEI